MKIEDPKHLFKIAEIKESTCVGCTKCIQACPVDAILGSPQHMHTVLTHECIGCGLCVAPCPVDCIEMIPVVALNYDKQVARDRAKAKKSRLLQHNEQLQRQYQSTAQAVNKEAKKDYILEALQRVKNKRKI